MEQRNPRFPRKNPQKSSTGPGLRARALGLLARREYSRRELESKLAQYTEKPHEIAELLDDFERRGWLSEQRAMEQMTASRKGRFGARRIEHDLREKGIAEDVISAALPALKEAEFEAARTVWRKKFGKSPQNAAERGRQMRFLQSRGFALETAFRVIGTKEDDDEGHAQ